jgi:steroid delta-isomerase-like uncharacterized protein
MTTDVQNILDTIAAGWNQKDWDMLAAIHDPEWVDLSVTDQTYNLDSMKEFFEEFTACFPDMEMEIIDSIVNQNQAAYFYQIRGTHQKDFLGIPAKGNWVSFDAMIMLTVKDGKVIHARGVSDKMTFFHQLRAQSAPRQN